jgi:hypothetical protein
MTKIRLIPAPLNIEFEEEKENFKEEFDKLGAEIDDPIGQYIKLAKARGETKDSDKLLLELVIALHRKVYELTKLVKNEEKELILLKYNEKITHVGYEHLKFEKEVLEPNQKYYGRLEISFFPQREVPIYFIAIEKDIAEIILMHERDIKDYNAFVASRERALIREKRGKK